MTEKPEPVSFESLAAEIIKITNTQLSDAGRADLRVSQDDFHLHGSSRPDPKSDLYFKFDVAEELPLAILPVFGLQSDETIEGFGSDLAKAILNLDAGRETLTLYHHSVRAAATEALEGSGGSGDRVRLAGVGLKHTYAYHLAHSKWQEAANFVLATIDLEITERDGEPDRRQIVVEEPEEVAGEIEAYLPR